MPPTGRLPRASHPRSLLPNRPAPLRAPVVSRHRHSANPARIPLSLFAPQSFALRLARQHRLTTTGAIRSP